MSRSSAKNNKEKTNKQNTAKNKSMQLLSHFPLGCFKFLKSENAGTRNDLRGCSGQTLLL